MKVKVEKRNGEIENYNPDKIIKVAVASGLTKKNAEVLAGKISKWVEKRNKAQVTTIQIRDRMIVEMQKINKRAADKFIWYEKLKDKHY